MDGANVTARSALLEPDFDELTPTHVSGSIVADERHHQPSGIVLGGLYMTAVETFATLGAVEAVRDRWERSTVSSASSGNPGGVLCMEV
jgi:acyl-coenzyme A thioesterase PaaI-like protein